jgi:hypothetical protein
MITEAVGTSERSVSFYEFAQRNIPESSYHHKPMTQQKCNAVANQAKYISELDFNDTSAYECIFLCGKTSYKVVVKKTHN